MSQAIEDKIVSLKFDNADFANKIGSTMSILEKFEQKLGFKNAGAGLNDVTKAAQNVDLSSIASGVDNINNKFSGLGVMAATVLSDITRKAENMVSSTMNQFTVEPIKAGFEEYETQMNAVQTILSNTRSKGSTIDDVTASLDELNTYADKTIYNFTEMTRNIGTFTAAGIDLETSTKSIQGIANLAAVSGSNSQQASTAMYQLSQALAAGTVKLQDWNSVVNAGMGGEVFQTALKRTAKAMGTDVDALIEQAGSFRESLASGWITKDVMTETLNQMAGVYSEAELLAKGYTDAEAKEIVALAKDAEDAATKVKTFTQLMDTLKEAVGSGWTTTFQYIFGNFEEAREMWSGVASYFSNIIDGISTERNDMLKEWHDLGGRTELIESLAQIGRTTMAVLREFALGIRDIIPPMTAERLLAITKGIREFARSLRFATYGGEEAKNGIRLIGQGVGVLLKILMTGIGVVVKVGSAVFKVVWSVVKTVLMLLGVLYNLGSTIKNAVSIPLTIMRSNFARVGTAFREFFSALTNGTKNVTSFGDKLKSIFEKSNIVQSIVHLANAVVELVRAFTSPIFSFVANIFSQLTESLSAFNGANTFTDFIESAVNAISSFIEAIASMVDSIHDTGIIQGIGRVFSQSAKSIVKGATAVSGVIFGTLKPAIDLIKNLLDGIGNSAKNFKNSMQNIGESVKNAFKSLQIGEGSSDTTVMKAPTFLETLHDSILDVFDNLGKSLGPKIEKVKELFSRIDFAELGMWLMVGIQSFFQMKAVKQFMDAVENLSGAFEGLGQIPDLLEGVSDVLEGYQNKLNADALKSIATAVAILAGSMLLMAMIPTERLPQAIAGLAGLLFVMSMFMDKLNDMSKDSGKSFQIIGKQFSMETGGLGDIVRAMIGVAVATLILAKAVSMLAEYDIGQLIVSVSACAALMVAMMALMGVLAGMNANDKFDFDGIVKIGIAMVGLSVAMLIMAGAVKLISGIDETGLQNAAMTLGTALMAMTLFVAIVGSFPEGKFLSAAVSTVAIAAAISMLTVPIMILGNMDEGKLKQGALAVGALLVVMAFISRAAKGSFGGAASILAFGVAITMLVIPIKMLTEMPVEEATRAANEIRKLIAIIGIAAMLAGVTKGGGGAILAIAIALTVLMIPLQMLSTMQPTAIAQGLITLAIALAVVIGAGYLAEAAAIGLLSLAIACLYIGAGTLMAGIGLQMLSVGLIALAGAGATVGASLAAIGVELAGGFAAALAIIAVGLAEAIVLFVETLAAAAPTILLQIEAIVKMIFKLIEDLGPEFIETVVPIIDKLLDVLVEKSPEWGEKLTLVIIGLLQGILTAILEKTGEFASAAGTLISSMATKFFEDTTIGQGIKTIFETCITYISDCISRFVELVTTIVKNIAGVFTGDVTIGEAFNNIWDAIIKAFDGTWIGKFIDIGSNIIDGIKKGISGAVDTVVAGAKYAGRAIANAVGEGADTHSPSKITTKTGRYIAQGVPVGVKKEEPKAIKSIKAFGKSMAEAVSSSLSMVGEEVPTVEPQISPVVDLSNLSKSNDILSSMFGTASMTRMQLAGIGDVSMGSIYSNMAVDTDNTDVVQEIKYLRQELEYVNNTIRSNSRPTTQHNYNIGGVTYGSDSEISAALESLMNAIKIKGRM